MLQGWLYRHLTPYGKVVVIKSLALSKLSHIALVVPCLAKKEMKNLEQIFFSFLWSNKTPKVSKIDSLKPLKMGGLAMVDVPVFWKSLKCTWVRRLLSSSAFWPEILGKVLKNHGSSINRILFSGPSYLQNLSKKINNKFWKNVLISLSSLSQEIAYAYPEDFYLFSVFENPIFKSENRCLFRSNFGNPSHGLNLVADFFVSENNMYGLDDLNLIHGTTITQVQLSRIQNAIKNGLTSLNLNLGKCNWHQLPRQSIIINIAGHNKRGCRAFYRTFRARPNDSSSTAKIETKWHEKLDTILSVTFWDSAWRLHASIRENNQLKWIQCQILRNSIYTNNRVSKFRNDVSDRCDFCDLHIENALTLFYSCDWTKRFWYEVKLFLLEFSHPLPLLKLQVLFGVHNEPYDSLSNISILIGKRVIWASKFKKIKPNLVLFKNTLKDYLVILDYCNEMKNTSSTFYDQWGDIYRSLGAVRDAPQP